MEASFWHERWEKNEIAFHQGEGNPLLEKYFDALSLPAGSRVFVPLCGKTGDISWLLSQGYRVVGAELNEMAIRHLFTDLGVVPVVAKEGDFKLYSAQGIDIFVGDFFALTAAMLGSVDAIYDRAALVALPEEMRVRYAAHLIEISDTAPQLLITYDYDQSLLPGPPFSISKQQVSQYYRNHYDVALLADVDVAGGLKGKCASLESVWLLKNS